MMKSVTEARDGLRESYGLRNARDLGPLAIVGSASEGIRFVAACRRQGIEIVGVYDSNPALVGSIIDETIVQPFEAIDLFDKSTPVIVASHRLAGPVRQLRALGFENVIPLAVVQVVFPEVLEPHMFYTDWLEDLMENQERLSYLMDLLGDETSRRTLDQVIGFRLTLDFNELRPVVDWNLFFPTDLITLNDDEVFVDAGAYRGDTLNMFIHRVGGTYSRVIALEPDPINFDALSAIFEREARVEVVPKGLYGHDGVMRFDGAEGKASILSADGELEVPVVTLDSHLNGDRVTFIKMNIEGAERGALMGARKAIKKWAPRLGVSAYHRPKDLWDIPLLIHEINPDFSIYLRQHDLGSVETVAYGLSA